MKRQLIVLLAAFLITGCLSSSRTQPEPGTREIGAHAVLYEGPELAAVVAFTQAANSLGDEWLILGVELTSPRGSGPFVIERDDISVRTPSGQRLPLALQEEYRGLFPRIQIPVDKALLDLPLLDRYQPNRRPCGKWFLVASDDVAFDEIPVSSFDICSGPLVFLVPGGVQPGPWRLVIELEEGRASIPFVIE
jgi:hypothetical protein